MQTLTEIIHRANWVQLAQLTLLACALTAMIVVLLISVFKPFRK